jgi:hypothetical protein
MELEEIFQSGWEVCLSPNAFVLSAPSKPEAFNLAYCKPEALAEWALRFGRGATLIKYPQCGDSHYRIPAAMANSLQVVMNDEQGKTYHVSWNLGMRDILQPALT